MTLSTPSGKGQEVKAPLKVNVVPSFPDDSAPKPKNCVHLAKAPQRVTICTYDPKDDVWVSGAIRVGPLLVQRFSTRGKHALTPLCAVECR